MAGQSTWLACTVLTYCTVYTVEFIDLLHLPGIITVHYVNHVLSLFFLSYSTSLKPGRPEATKSCSDMYDVSVLSLVLY